MKKILRFLILLTSIAHFSQTDIDKKKKQELLITKYIDSCAEKYSYTRQMKKWQGCIDEGLKIDSTVAYFWQQKAMPYFKVRKYEIGMTYIDKAVKLDDKRWQPYRTFIKCIFAKTYKAAIEDFEDFEDCKKKFGNNYVMDHTYDFYIGLCYLQLDDFVKAEKLFQNYADDALNKRGESWVHPTLLFYLGITQFEQDRFDDAIKTFDRALKNFPNLSDAKLYKAFCLASIGKKEEAKIEYENGVKDYKAGYSLNEDITIYL